MLSNPVPKSSQQLLVPVGSGVAFLLLTLLVSPDESGSQNRYFKFSCQLAPGLTLHLGHLGSSWWNLHLKVPEMVFLSLETGPALPEEINTPLWEILLSGKMSNLSEISSGIITNWLIRNISTNIFYCSEHPARHP